MSVVDCADARQRDLRRDRARPAAACRDPAAPRSRRTLAFNNVAAYREFDRALTRSRRAMSMRISTGCGIRRRSSTASAGRPSLNAPAVLRPRCRRGRFPARPAFDAIRHRALDAGRVAPERSRELARRVGIPELIMCDAGHAAGPRMRDYGGFGDPASTKTALLIEARPALGAPLRRGRDRCDAALPDRRSEACRPEDVAALGGPDLDARSPGSGSSR